MKYSISKIVVAISILLSYTISNAQIKNAITEEVKIYGNCGMCEKTIEEAGNSKKIAQVDWNKDTKMATLTYDAKKTNKDEILAANADKVAEYKAGKEKMFAFFVGQTMKASKGSANPQKLNELIQERLSK